MVLMETITIFWYFVFRLLLQLIPSKDNKSLKSIRMCRVIPGIIALPLVTNLYWTYYIDYMSRWVPGTWEMSPMPVTFFVAWIIFLVTDSLYQFHMISKIPESNTQ